MTIRQIWRFKKGKGFNSKTCKGVLHIIITPEMTSSKSSSKLFERKKMENPSTLKLLSSQPYTAYQEIKRENFPSFYVPLLLTLYHTLNLGWFAFALEALTWKSYITHCVRWKKKEMFVNKILNEEVPRERKNQKELSIMLLLVEKRKTCGRKFLLV